MIDTICYYTLGGSQAAATSAKSASSRALKATSRSWNSLPVTRSAKAATSRSLSHMYLAAPPPPHYSVFGQNGVNTDGAAAKVIIVDRLGKKYDLAVSFGKM